MKQNIAEKFDTYPPYMRPTMNALRALVFSVAESLDIELEESLKWGEPAYRPTNGQGTTLRFDWKERSPDQYAVYVPCSTTLIEDFRNRFPEVDYQGDRALSFNCADPIPEAELRAFCELTFQYFRS